MISLVITSSQPERASRKQTPNFVQLQGCPVGEACSENIWSRYLGRGPSLSHRFREQTDDAKHAKSQGTKIGSAVCSSAQSLPLHGPRHIMVESFSGPGTLRRRHEACDPRSA